MEEKSKISSNGFEKLPHYWSPGYSSFFQGGYYLFNIIDNYVGGFPLLFSGIFEIIAIIYIYGKNICTVLPAKSESDVVFCLQSYQGLRIDRSLQ